MTEIEKLVKIMADLRDPKSGCPWDQEQTLESILPYSWEELHELADAIQSGDMDGIKDELGDLLFHIVYYSQIASEKDAFDFKAVINAANDKLIRRHPHVFADGTVDNSRAQADSWESIKTEERYKNNPSSNSILSDIKPGIAPIQRALKLQNRAATVGFDWDNAGAVVDKVIEELQELKQEIDDKGSQDAREDEFGDVMFACVNLARHLNIEPELSLRKTNNKFIRRFNFIEQRLQEQNISFKDVGLSEMEELWQESKIQGY